MQNMDLHKLFPGSETEEKIRLLAKAARLTSEDKFDALVEHYTKGTPQSLCAVVYDMSQQNIDLAAKKLNKAYKLAHQIVWTK